jgi:NAD+ kinase
MLLKKLGPELLAELREVAAFCGGEQGLAVLVEAHDRADLAAAGFSPPYLRSWTAEEAGNLHARVDFVVCLGGDGLMLHAADLFGSSIPPVISFKLGSLGFLTCHDYADHRRHLADVIGGCQELSTCKVTGGGAEGRTPKGGPTTQPPN